MLIMKTFFKLGVLSLLVLKANLLEMIQPKKYFWILEISFVFL